MKKSKINGFKPFSGYDDIGDGLKIPAGKIIEPKQEDTQQIKSKLPIQPFKAVHIDNKGFTPMTNIVPTIENGVPVSKSTLKGLTRKQKQRIMPEDLNANEYGALLTKQEKISYLAMHGWSLKVERRGNTLYHYATRYVNRKKKRLYLGSVNE